MDLSAKVEARRAELARQKTERAEQEKRIATALRERDEERNRQETERLAGALAQEGLPVTSDADSLILDELPPLAALDPADFSRRARERLLKKEARRRWTPGENWIVIASITAGLLLVIPTFAVGGVLVVAGWAIGQSFNRQHRTQLARDFPDLFADLVSSDAKKSA